MTYESTVPGELGDPAVRAAEVPEPGAVTIVVPTFNESANIRELLQRINESGARPASLRGCVRRRLHRRHPRRDLP